MKQGLQNIENGFQISDTRFLPAKQQAIHDIERGIVFIRHANSNFDRILGEYVKFKSGNI